MKFNTLSSVVVIKNIAFFGVLAILSFLFYIFLPDEEITANISSSINITESEFITALEKNDELFFSRFFNEQQTKEKEIFITDILKKYPKKIDIAVLKKNNFFFYSFLGIKEKSTLLENIYGAWNSKTKKFTTFDEIQFSIMQQKPYSITFTNNSNIAVPVDKSFILTPSEITGKTDFPEILLLPGDSFIFTSEKKIPEHIFQLESLYYGYKAIIQ